MATPTSKKMRVSADSDMAPKKVSIVGECTGSGAATRRSPLRCAAAAGWTGHGPQTAPDRPRMVSLR